MDTKRIGRRIKAFRKLKGYTQIKFAKKLRLSLSRLGAIERGTLEASDELLSDIADFLGIDKKEITLEGKETEQNEDISTE
ncbi:helix-turn-helix transcriptional regulator [Virgibacillus sp. MSJ-26]|uniref:helix-turn-helix domain-containing protein n=1 Tax=Virgibacillus sp. MSJ-26 TaxID=2841522 RepID=UPI001C10003C|nr:helix-turn-helix transcriptional regulator [Virgibacillus sp. MSJ-26]MBU5468682.1 helix-turn-helix transcriptional regulator [Virgibacillus sp. MSJ-26]